MRGDELLHKPSSDAKTADRHTPSKRSNADRYIKNLTPIKLNLLREAVG